MNWTNLSNCTSIVVSTVHGQMKCSFTLHSLFMGGWAVMVHWTWIVYSTWIVKNEFAPSMDGWILLLIPSQGGELWDPPRWVQKSYELTDHRENLHVIPWQLWDNDFILHPPRWVQDLRGDFKIRRWIRARTHLLNNQWELRIATDAE